MTTPEMMTHSSEETLAAFVEGRLEGEARRQVVEHIADCGECRSIVLMAEEITRADTKAANVVHGRFGKRFLMPWVAAAAVVALVFALPSVRQWFQPHYVERIAEATEGLRYRVSEARLSGNYPYRPVAPHFRGNEVKETEAQASQTFLNAAVRTETQKRGNAIDRLRALAAVHLYLGENDTALATLEEALLRAEASNITPRQKAALLNDLAVAHLENDTGDDHRHLLAALKAADGARALDAQSAPVAWTRALILEKLNRRDAALRAWQDYLRLDPSSAWSEEARKHLTEPE